MPDPIKSRAEYERQKSLYGEYMRQKEDFYKKAYGAAEPPTPIPAPPEERSFIGTAVDLGKRAINRAMVSGMETGADIGEMLQFGPAGTPIRLGMGNPNRPAELRQKAAALEAKVPAAQTLPEYIASGVGYMAPDVVATVLGGMGVQSAAAKLGPASRLGRLLTPKKGAGVIRRNIPGAIAAAPVVTVPGALSEESRRSATGNLGEMLTGKRPSTPVRVAGDIALDVLGGAVAEKLLINPVAKMFGKRAAATAADVPITGPVTTPPRTEPLRLGAGSYAMPASTDDFAFRQARIDEVMRRAQEDVARAQELGGGRTPTTVPVLSQEDIADRLAALAAQAGGKEGSGLVVPEVFSPRGTRRQNILRGQAEQSARQIQSDLDNRRAMATPDMGATRQLEAAAEAGSQQRGAQPKPLIETFTGRGRRGSTSAAVLSPVGGAGLGATGGLATAQSDDDMTPLQRALAFGTVGAGLASGKAATALRALGREAGGEVGEAGERVLGRRSSGSTIPQEVRAVGRFGLVKPPETYVLNEALEREHVGNVLAATSKALSNVGARVEESVKGAGLFGGEVSPNTILRFAADASDEDVRVGAAARGLAFAQDQQLIIRELRPTDTESTAGLVLTGPDFAPLSDATIDAVITRLRADDALGPYGGATREGDHLLVLNPKRYATMDDATFQETVTRVIGEVSQTHGIDINPSTYYAEHLDGNADYARTLAGRPDAIRAARDAISAAKPEYIRYATAVGADVTATEREIADRIGALDRLLNQVENPPQLGRTKGGAPLVEAARQVYSQFPRLGREDLGAVVPEMVSRLGTMVDDLVDTGVLNREMAQDFYRGATLDQRQIARLALPELREDPKYTLYTIVNSILSSGQQVAAESRQGLNVFEQYLRTATPATAGNPAKPGRFSILDPASVQYKQSLTGGKKAFTGFRGTGLLGERMAASPRTLNHEQALNRLDALVQALGEDGAVKALTETVPIMKGKTVIEERPALVFLFGPKIGQYAMDKLGIIGGDKSTIDLWMARLNHMLLGVGDDVPLKGKALNDDVDPAMRNRMQAVVAQYAKEKGISESSAQAVSWYAIKNAFRRAGSTEKKMAYATLGSATTDALATPLPKEFTEEPLTQGMAEQLAAYDRAAEGWDDPTLRDFAKKTGRKGTIAPTAGAFAGKVFDVGGAFGAAVGTQFGREALPKIAVGVGGYELEQTFDDPRLKATGQGMQLLGALSLGYQPSKVLVRSGAVNLKDALAQSPKGRMALNLISRDILIDPKIKSLVELAEREMSKYRAIGIDLARRARALGPEGDRLVSDIVEGEKLQSRAGMDDETVKAAMAVAEKVAQEVVGLGEQKVATGTISQATFERRKASYLKRIYAAFKGGEAMKAITIRKGNKTFRIEPERVRNENLTVDERNALGEIREASVRLGETFTRGGKNIATSRLFNALADIDGVIAPAYKQAMDQAENARLLSDAAYASGDTEMGKAARGAEMEAKRTMKGLAQEIVASDDQYIMLPDAPKLSFLRGAVVRKDAAEYLMAMPDFGIDRVGARGIYDNVMRFWKRVHTVYNPATHVGNFVSNASKVHMGGLSLMEQPVYLTEAWKDLRNYGPATKALAEAGVLERGIPTYGDIAVEGIASQKQTLQQLAKTTRLETRQALKAQGVEPRGKAREFAGWASQKAQTAYALEDGVYRVALYKKLRDNGMGGDEALKEVERVLPGYDTRSPLLTGIKNSVSPFIMYPVKYIPSLMEDIMDHPERWVILAALWGGMDQWSRRQYTPVDERDLRPEERMNKRLGYLMPGTIQVDAFMRPLAKMLKAEPKRGENYTFNISRFTPLSLFSGSSAPGSVLGKLLPGVPGASILQPSGPLPEILARYPSNVDPFTGRTWMTGGESGLQKARMVAEDMVLPFFTPTAVSYYGKKLLKESIPSENRSEILSDVMGLLGTKSQIVRPGLQSRYEREDFMKQMQAVKTKRDNLLRKTESPERRQELLDASVKDLQRIRAKYSASRQALNDETKR